MRKTKGVLIGVLLMAVVLAITGCGKDEEAGTDGPARKQIETVKPNEDDGAVYQVAEDYVNALVRDDRQQVLSMLTADHRSSWKDDSFLIRQETKERFDAIELEDVRHTVVRYINNEETNNVNTAMLIIVYDVVMKNAGETKAKTKIQESLAFRNEDGKWLITMNERGFLVQK